MASVSASKIQPGEGAEISLVLDTLGLKEGRSTESIGISTNDPRSPHFRLTVGVEVFSEFTVDPLSLDLGLAPPNSRIQRVVMVRVATTADIDVTGVVSLDPGFAATVRRIPASNSYEVLVDHLPKKTRGTYFGLLKLTTSSAAMPEIFVPVRSVVNH